MKKEFLLSRKKARPRECIEYIKFQRINEYNIESMQESHAGEGFQKIIRNVQKI